MSRLRKKWLALAATGGVVIQLSACVGGDPAYFFGSTVANAIVYNVVSGAFDAVRVLFGSIVTGA